MTFQFRKLNTISQKNISNLYAFINFHLEKLFCNNNKKKNRVDLNQSIDVKIYSQSFGD